MPKQAYEQKEPSLDSDIKTSKDSEPKERTVKSRSNIDTWKNTGQTLWKP
jgi:hypothetical protein